MDKQLETLVSIIVPCYNQGIYLNDALESVWLQSISNWECIIVDDGSEDETNDIVCKWINKDLRFKYYYIDNVGVSEARNFGIKKAEGIFILPLDADDKISYNYLELGLKEFEKDESLKVVYSQAEKFGDEDGFWHLKPFTHFNLAVGNIIFCSAIYRKKDWQLIGGYDSKMRDGLEDWEFWIHLLKNGGKAFQIHEVCFFYRIRRESRNKAIDYQKKNNILNYLSVKHADFFVEQFGSFHRYMEEGINDNRKLKALLRSRKQALKILFRGIFNFWKY